MHEILSRHPAYLSHMEEVAQFDEAEAAIRKRMQAERDQSQAALAAHGQAKSEALERGEEPPAAPDPPPDRRDEARWVVDRRSALRAQRRELLADLAGEVEEAARNRMAEVFDEARPLLAELESLAVEAADLVSTVRMVKVPAEREAGVAAGQGTADKMRHGVSVLDLAAAVVDGFSLLAPVDAPGPQIIAAKFEAPQPAKPSRPLPSQDRTPSPIQVKGI